MAKIRINPDIIDNYGNNIKGQAGYVLQRAESVNHAAMNAPSYNGQFGPKVRAIGASAHSAGRQHTERLSNQGQNLCSIGAHFRSVDTLQLYASGAYREFFSPDTESWFVRKIREFRIHLTQHIQKNEEKLENLRKDEIWYSNEIASVLDKIAQKNRTLAFILRGLIKRGDTAKLRDFIRRNRNLSVFFLGLPSYWQLNYLLQAVEIRDRKRKEIAKTEKELESDRRLLEKIGGPLQPENEVKPQPTPVPAPQPMPQPVPTPPVPAPQPNAPANPNGREGFGDAVADDDPVNPYTKSKDRHSNDWTRLSNCTWYAWQAVYEWSGKNLQIPIYANASDWANIAQNALIRGETWIKSVNNMPEPGSVLCKDNHVCFVESLITEPDGKQYVIVSDEQNGLKPGWPNGWMSEIKHSNPKVARWRIKLPLEYAKTWRSINFNYPA